MRLIEYPDAIAQAERAVVEAQEQVRALTPDLELCKAKIAVEVNEDKSLTNADKRKTAKLEREATDPDYIRDTAALLERKNALALAEIEATRLRNLFKVECLLAQRAA